MSTALTILGWSVKGLRCPDHSVSFEKDENQVYKISLVQMPNGTGKTTTLKLLRAALGGPAIWTTSFDKPNSFKKNADTTMGFFELKLRHSNRRLTITMEFDFSEEERLPTYKTTSTLGTDVGYNLPDELIPFLKPEFIKLLIFDGELANQLLSPYSTNAQDAIEVLYQLPILKQMRDRIENYWESKAAQSGSKGGDVEKSRRQTKVNQVKEHLAAVERRKTEDENQLEKISSTLKDLDHQFSEEIKKDKEERNKHDLAEKALTSARTNLVQVTKSLADIIKNPAELSHKFDQSITELKGSFDRVKLPGIAAREFFEEIAEETHCICGRHIDEEIGETIRQGADQYLGSEEIATINAMKSDINSRVNTGGCLSNNDLVKSIKDVEAAQDQVSHAQQKLDTIKLSASSKDPAIKKIHDQITSLTAEQSKLIKGNEKYTDIGDQTDRSWNPEIVRRRLKEAEDALAETTNTIDLKRKKDVLQRIIDNAFDQSKELLSEEIKVLTNKRIEVVMPNNNVRVDRIDKSIRLVDKDSASAGETLTVGYAFLSSLLYNSNHVLPSVVDSPSGPIDLDIRPEIGRLIPKLSAQFICFIISSERQGFTDPLIKAAPEIPFFITMFRKGNQMLEVSTKRKFKFQETEDCISVVGQTFFDSFHSDNE